MSVGLTVNMFTTIQSFDLRPMDTPHSVWSEMFEVLSPLRPSLSPSTIPCLTSTLYPHTSSGETGQKQSLSRG